VVEARVDGRSMSEIHLVHIYCDESCHLLADRQKAMVLGGVWCPAGKVAEHHRMIAQLKAKHGMPPFFEMKWNSTSPYKLALYTEVIEYFFNALALGFRAWVVPDKAILQHREFGQTHDEWYYKMYFYLLRNMIDPSRRHRVFIDLKDTRGRMKLRKLHEVLSAANYDFSRDIIADMQHVHSHDVGLMQLADLLIGAVSYHTRGLAGNAAKECLVKLIKDRTGLSLSRNTLPSAKKFNLCVWKPDSKELEHV